MKITRLWTGIGRTMLLGGLSLWACVTTPTPQPVGGAGVGTSTTPDYPCIGSARAVYDRCGCSPVDGRLINRVSALGFRENVQLSIRQCANGHAGLDIRATQLFAATFEGCVSRQVTLDATLRNSISTLVQSAAQETSPAETEAWLSCFRTVTGATTTTSPSVPADAAVP